MAAVMKLTSGLVCALCVLVANVHGYTDPVLSPKTVKDSYGNTADLASKITFAKIPGGKPYLYTDPPEENPLLAGFMKMVRGFTHMLQPGEPPYEMLGGFLDGTADIMANIKDLAFYFAGFAVCIVIGIFFMIVMPIVCCCFCCCRMCGKCGGKRVRPDPDKKATCRCITFSLILFVVVANIAIGASLVYLMDARMSASIGQIGSTTGNNLNDIGTFLDNMVFELEYAAKDGFNFVGDVVIRDLDNIGAIFGVAAKEAFNNEAGVDAAVNSIIDMDTKMDTAEADMAYVNGTQEAFKEFLDIVTTSLDDVKTALINAKTDGGCAASCQAMDTTGLASGVDHANLPNITHNLILIRALQEQDLSQSAIDGKKDFDEMPERITNDTKQNVADMKTMINDFRTTIADSLNQISTVSDQKEMLESQTSTITEYTDLMGNYNTPRSYAFLGLSAFIWFICLFFLIGIVLGCVGFRSDASPQDRSGCSNCGGHCLMAGVGFCFIFSTLFMLLVTLPFIIGAPLDRFLCEPLMDPELKIMKELLDKPDGPLGEGYFLGGMLLQDNTLPLTLSGVLQECKNNTAAYKALMLKNLFDISTVTNYKDQMDIEKELDGLDSDMSDVQILSSETKQILVDFKTALDVDYNAYYTELVKLIDTIDFDQYATTLRTVADDGTNSGAIQAIFHSQAAEMDTISEVHAGIAEDVKVLLKEDVEKMEQSSADVPDAIDEVIANSEATENFIQTNGSVIVKQEAGVYANRILGTIDQFVEFVVNKLETEIGGCVPLWNIWKSLIHDSLCNSVVLSLNGFWFGLGWCTFFMVLAIIFGVRLTKYLRRANHQEKNQVGPESQMDGKEATSVAMSNPQPNRIVVSEIISSPPPSYTSMPPKPPPPVFASSAEKW